MNHAHAPVPAPDAGFADISAAADRGSEGRAIFAYVAPMAAFGLLTWLEQYVPASLYFAAYVIKACIVTAVLMTSGVVARDVRPSRRVVVPAVLVGLAIFVQWILLDQWVPVPHIGGERVAFNPFVAFDNPWSTAAFLAVRFYGLVLMVPVMEELFWRSFMIRYLTDTNFLGVSAGTFSVSAFWIVAGASALSHPEWLVALIAGCAFALLLRQTRSLFAVILAHAVANLALGLYVVLTGSWQYW